MQVGPDPVAAPAAKSSRRRDHASTQAVHERRDDRASLPPQVLVEARQDLDEVAGPVAVVELRRQDLVPGVAAGAGAARQREEVGAVRHARRWPGSAPREVPIFCIETMVKTVPKASISFS